MTAKLRREVSPENPLILHTCHSNWIRGIDMRPSELLEMLPEDIRTCSAMSHVPDWWDPEKLPVIKEYLDECERIGLQQVLQTTVFKDARANNFMPQDILKQLFDEYTCLIGVLIVEQGIAQFDQPDRQNIIDTIHTMAEIGGTLFWAEMIYHRHHPFMVAGEDEGLYRAISENSDHVVFIDKANGRTQYFLSQSAAMGWWLTGNAAAWGINAEDFWWFETAYKDIWSLPAKPRSYSQWQSTASFPANLYAQVIERSMASGASVYKVEYPLSLMYKHSKEEKWYLTSQWEHAVYPMLQKVANGWVASEDQVRSKIKACYHATDMNAPEIAPPETRLFKGLYGAEHTPAEHWHTYGTSLDLLPHEGRYFFIPVTPKLAPPPTDLGDVINPENYPVLFPDVQSKQAWFNERYVQEQSGSSWSVRVDKKWYIFNHHENANLDTDFDISLQTNTCSALYGEIGAHTSLLVEEAPDSLDILLNNYRVDIKELWNGDFPCADFEQYCDYMDKHVKAPAHDKPRQTVLVVKGVPPNASLKADLSGMYTEHRFDRDTERADYRLEIMHNGPVQLRIGMSAEQ
ncbi:MAG: hypothetical protein HN341_13535 [Verrucomicrobia bacterium]|jgi:hypothetical protein|nr:hypothetical protein [Verrucomicrobiota bacterium]